MHKEHWHWILDPGVTVANSKHVWVKKERIEELVLARPAKGGSCREFSAAGIRWQQIHFAVIDLGMTERR